ncbi:MAG: serine/threonine-protein kinase [Planctomycetota bacterium]
MSPHPQHDTSDLSDFLKRTKSATMKQVQDLAGASSLGLYLAEGTSEGSTADTYKVRTAWDHRDKAKRAKCVRTMGTESAKQHEVWLTFWSKDRADIEAVRTAAGGEPAWQESQGGRYQRGPAGLSFDDAKGTVTLIYSEGRTSPFTSAEYCAHLGELYDELAALVASAGAAAPASPAPAATVGQAPSKVQPAPAGVAGPKGPVEIPVAQAARPAGGPSPGTHAQAYGSPADLVAALESGAIEIYKKSASVKVRGRDADVVVVDESRGKGLTLTIAGVAEVDAGVLAACRGALNKPSFSARRAEEGGLVIRRKLRSMPAPADIREALDYAAKFLEALESGPLPGTGPAEEPPPPPEERVEVAPGEAASPAEVEAPLPSPPEPAAAQPPPEEPATAPAAEEAPPPAAPSEQAAGPSGSSSEIIEVEEVSLEELLGTSSPGAPAAEEAPAPAAAAAEAAPAEPVAPLPAAPVSSDRTELYLPAEMPGDQPAGGAAGEPAGEPSKEPAEETAEEPAPELPEEVPDTPFGDFRASRAIGRDVLGVLYAGENTESGEPVAIKVIDLEHTQNVRFAQAFIRESWGASKLEHPGLKRVLTVGRTPAHIYFYVSEFVEGTSVRTLVESEGAFSAADSGRIVLALCEALAFAHSQKVFHGDIRPSHVLLAPDGGVKLGEMAGARNILRAVERLLEKRGWNLADALKDEDKEARAEMKRLIRERGVVAWYVAPELAEPQEQADARADVYGLGATWYFMLVGRPPFQGNPPFRVLTGEAGAVVPPHNVNPAVPAEVSRVVQKMMDPVPSERYQLMEEVMAELAGLMGL